MLAQVPSSPMCVPVAEHHRLRQENNHIQEALLKVLAAIVETPAGASFVAGGLSGAVSRTVTAPLDRLKVLAQDGRLTPRVPNAAPGTRSLDWHRMAYLGNHVYRNEGGLRGFWRGNGVNCLKAGPEYATAFMVRQCYVDLFCADPKAPTFRENVFVGGLAGVSAQTLMYPLEVVKTRMAASKPGEYHSIADCFMQSVRRGGVADLYRGLGANMAGVFPHRGLELGAFFTMKQSAVRWYNGEDVPVLVVGVISFIASIFSQILTYPLNLGRTRMQMQGVHGRPVRYRNLVHCLTTVCRQDGPRGLFVGLLPNILKAVPASMVMYLLFDRIKQTLDRLPRKALK